MRPRALAEEGATLARKGRCKAASQVTVSCLTIADGGYEIMRNTPVKGK